MKQRVFLCQCDIEEKQTVVLVLAVQQRQLTQFLDTVRNVTGDDADCRGVFYGFGSP